MKVIANMAICTSCWIN